jgi:hypothetical protein
VSGSGSVHFPTISNSTRISLLTVIAPSATVTGVFPVSFWRNRADPLYRPIPAFHIDLHSAGLAVARQMAVHNPAVLSGATDLGGAKANFMKFSAIQNVRRSIVF